MYAAFSRARPLDSQTSSDQPTAHCSASTQSAAHACAFATHAGTGEALRKLRSVDPRTAADVALEAGGLAWREINQIAEKLRRAGAYDKVDEPKAPGKFMMSVEGSKDAMWPPPAPEPPTVLGKKSKGTIDGGGVQG